MSTLVSLGSVRKTRRPGSRLSLYYMEMQPKDMLSGGLLKWVADAQILQRRITGIRRRLEEVKIEEPERSAKLDELLTRFSVFIPKMIRIMEKAIEDIRGIT